MSSYGLHYISKLHDNKKISNNCENLIEQYSMCLLNPYNNCESIISKLNELNCNQKNIKNRK